MSSKNSTQALDLYSKVEDLLGIEDATTTLHAHYLLALSSLDFETLLDVGSGSGDFIIRMQRAFPHAKFMGIDLSPHMVSKAKAKGVDAKAIDLCDMLDSFDVITAVFDMLNYIDRSSLKAFLLCIEEHLTDNGIFIFDINSLYGFSDVSVGSINIDDNDRFLAIDSEFEDSIYSADFTLFEKNSSTYIKSQANIKQYYYTLDDIVGSTNLELVSCDDISLYTEEADKQFLIFQKRKSC